MWKVTIDLAMKTWKLPSVNFPLLMNGNEGINFAENIFFLFVSNSFQTFDMSHIFVKLFSFFLFACVSFPCPSSCLVRFRLT